MNHCIAGYGSRIRFGVFAVLLAATSGACGGEGTPTSPTTSPATTAPTFTSTSAAPTIATTRPKTTVAAPTTRPRTVAPTTPRRIPTTTAAPVRNCDPAYPDVCLHDGIGDYDCAGGSGDGPNYVDGPIRVLPADPFGLDRDGDGIGCE